VEEIKGGQFDPDLAALKAASLEELQKQYNAREIEPE
jgi:hypothetical protein